MTVIVVLKFTHTAEGMHIESNIHPDSKGFCLHELTYAQASAEAVSESSKELNAKRNQTKHSNEGNKNVH